MLSNSQKKHLQWGCTANFLKVGIIFFRSVPYYAIAVTCTYLDKVFDDNHIILCGTSTQHSLPLVRHIRILYRVCHRKVTTKVPNYFLRILITYIIQSGRKEVYTRWACYAPPTKMYTALPLLPVAFLQWLHIHYRCFFDTVVALFQGRRRSAACAICAVWYMWVCVLWVPRYCPSISVHAVFPTDTVVHVRCNKRLHCCCFAISYFLYKYKSRRNCHWLIYVQI